MGKKRIPVDKKQFEALKNELGKGFRNRFEFR